MNKIYSFSLNGEEIEICLNSDHFDELKEQVKAIISTEGKYQVHSNVPKDIFELYFRYFIYRKRIPVINSDNILQYYLLDDEFQNQRSSETLISIMSRPEYDEMRLISMIKNTNSDDNESKSTCEKFIAQNLDFYIKNYPEEMRKIQLQSLYNIFSHTERKLENHDDAYSFIINDSRNRLLIQLLDCSKLKFETLKEIISNKDRYIVTPKIDIEFIQKVEKSYQELYEIEQKNNEELQLIKQKVIDGELTYVIYPFISKSIENNFFYQCSNLKNVIIPSSVTSIGDNAFSQCISLVEIIIPSSVKYIGNYCFSHCTSLVNVTIPSSIEFIGKAAFIECHSLECVNGDLNSIPGGIFFNCSSLKNITISSSVKYIGEFAFCCCGSLTNIKLPQFLNSIREGAFLGCRSLKSIEIPSSIKTIKESVFDGCSSLIHIYIPTSVKVIRTCAFKNCSSLKQIEIPKSVRKMGKSVFAECTSLINVYLPLSLQSIEESTFNKCCSLSNIEIPISIRSIKKNAFLGCSSLKEIKIPSSIFSIGKDSFPDETVIIRN